MIRRLRERWRGRREIALQRQECLDILKRAAALLEQHGQEVKPEYLPRLLLSLGLLTLYAVLAAQGQQGAAAPGEDRPEAWVH
jgi:hypothetical protein